MHPEDESGRSNSTTLTDEPADARYRDAGHQDADGAHPPAELDGEQPDGQRPRGWYPEAEPVLPVDESAAATEPAPWVAEDDVPEPVAGGSDRSKSTVDDAGRESDVDGDPVGSAVGGWTADSERAADEAQVVEPVAGEPGVVVVEPAGSAELAGAQEPGAEGSAGAGELVGAAGRTPAEEDEAALTAPYGSDVAGAEVAGIEPATIEPAGSEPAGSEAAGSEPAGSEPAGSEPAADAVPAEAVPAAEAVPGGLDAEQPLGAAADVGALRARWRDVLASFVDDPAAAVSQAADLVDEAVRALTSELADLRDSAGEWSGDEPQTERMRMTVRRYRDVFDRLLRD